MTPAQMPGLKDEIAASSREDALQDERLRQRVADELRARLANDATDAREACGNSAHLSDRNFRTHAEIPHASEPTYAEIPHTSPYLGRTRTRASEHVHVPTSVPQSMLHEHEHARGLADGDAALRAFTIAQLEGRIDGESLYLLDGLEAIAGPDARRFRRTWLMRLCDRWSGCAVRAIAEATSRAKGGERPLIGWGETANDLFNRNKLAMRKPAKKA
jgi:hypothetical protein